MTEAEKIKKMQDALEAVLLFYDPRSWNEVQHEWKKKTGETECSSKILCNCIKKSAGRNRLFIIPNMRDIIICLVVSALIVLLIMFIHEGKQKEMDRTSSPIKTHLFRSESVRYSVDEIEIDGQTYLVLIDCHDVPKCIVPKPVSAVRP